MKIHKGDTVVVLPGQGQGQEGRGRPRHPSRERVILEGVNVAKRHAKPTPRHPAGRRHRQVHARPRLDRGARLQELRQADAGRLPDYDDGEKVRVCKKCGAEL